MDTQDPGVTGGPSDVGIPGVESGAEPEFPAAPTFPPAPHYPPPLASGPAGRPKGRLRNLGLVIGVPTLVVILVLVGGGVAENAMLSSTYSPERAVTDYFAAQSQGDVSGMLANATFQKGTNPEFFNRSAIVPMMDMPQNRDVHNVKVISSRSIDSSTQSVAVSMTWAGNQHSQTYTVRKDDSQVHDLLYHSWRIVIPFVTILLYLPNQPGPIQVDGITPATSDVSTIQAVEGYHDVTMRANFLYDSISQIVDGVHGGPIANATFAPVVSSQAVTMAAASIKLAFPNCDASKYDYCLNYTYSVPAQCSPAGCVYHAVYWPGYGTVLYTTYRLTLVGDPTTGMILVVSKQAGQLNANGTCMVTETFNGSLNFNFVGTWAAVLTWENGKFTADMTRHCSASP